MNDTGEIRSVGLLTPLFGSTEVTRPRRFVWVSNVQVRTANPLHGSGSIASRRASRSRSYLESGRSSCEPPNVQGRVEAKISHGPGIRAPRFELLRFEFTGQSFNQH